MTSQTLGRRNAAPVQGTQARPVASKTPLGLAASARLL